MLILSFIVLMSLFVKFRFDLSENYAIQSREDEAEALSSMAYERLRLSLEKSDASKSGDVPLAKLNQKRSLQKASAIVKLAPSDVELWLSVIRKLNLLQSVTSSAILQHILQMNLASPDEVTRMLPYATHLKVAAFARMHK
jgi:hypothetical protein